MQVEVAGAECQRSKGSEVNQEKAQIEECIGVRSENKIAGSEGKG